MRVGIIGDANRSVAWEKHLRPLTVVQEVVIAPTLSGLGEVQACFIIDDSENNLTLLTDTIRLGIHSYLISKLPVDKEKLEKIYHNSQEADVRIQFSHWPSIAPSTQWMKQQLSKPDSIQIIRENSHLNFTENRKNFYTNWVDELALVTKWFNMGTHRIEISEISLQEIDIGIRIFIKYENGSSASIYYMAAGEENGHRRIVSDNNQILDLDVITQKVRVMRVQREDRLSIEKREFDATRAAELSATLFFKAIQLKQDTAFTPYDALQTAKAVEKIHRFMGKS